MCVGIEYEKAMAESYGSLAIFWPIDADCLKWGRKAVFLQYFENGLKIYGILSDILKDLVISIKCNHPITGPELPHIRFGHCGVRINKTTLMIIGGIRVKQNYDQTNLPNLRFSEYRGEATDTTYYFDFTSFSWSEGPKLNDVRIEGYGCTVAMLSDEPTIFVSNGKHETFTEG